MGISTTTRTITRTAATVALIILLTTIITACGPNERDEYLRSGTAPPLAWPELATCINTSMTQTPGIVEPKGIVSSESITREVQIATAITVCAAELQGQRPPNLPDENCFLDEFDAYVFKYYLEPLKKSQTWRAERAYATLACTPIGADKQTN